MSPFIAKGAVIIFTVHTGKCQGVVEAMDKSNGN